MRRLGRIGGRGHCWALRGVVSFFFLSYVLVAGWHNGWANANILGNLGWDVGKYLLSTAELPL